MNCVSAVEIKIETDHYYFDQYRYPSSDLCITYQAERPAVSTLLILKLLLTPTLMIAVTLAGRRWGPKVAGLLAGLPLTSAPVSVFLAIEQGADFAAKAALGSLSGVGSVGVFCLAYALAARRFGWLICTWLGIASFLIFTTLLSVTTLGWVASIFEVTVTLVVVMLFFPRVSAVRSARRPPTWDVPARAATATGVVFLITSIAATLGARLTGLISPFPVFANVLAAFSHRGEGHKAGVVFLRSTVMASFGFGSFFFVVGNALPHFGICLTYSAATLIALSVSWATFRIDRTLAIRRG